MKKCPHCQQQAVSLRQWGQGLNAFKTVCRSCGKKIKATRITYVMALLCFGVLFGTMIKIMPDLKKQYYDWGIRDFIIPGIAFLICLIAYPFCSYNKDE